MCIFLGRRCMLSLDCQSNCAFFLQEDPTLRRSGKDITDTQQQQHLMGMGMKKKLSLSYYSPPLPPSVYLNFQFIYTITTYRLVGFWEQQNEISTCLLQITSFTWITFTMSRLIFHYYSHCFQKGGCAYSLKQSEKTPIS